MAQIVNTTSTAVVGCTCCPLKCDKFQWSVTSFGKVWQVSVKSAALQCPNEGSIAFICQVICHYLGCSLEPTWHRPGLQLRQKTPRLDHYVYNNHVYKGVAMILNLLFNIWNLVLGENNQHYHAVTALLCHNSTTTGSDGGTTTQSVMSLTADYAFS